MTELEELHETLAFEYKSTQPDRAKIEKLWQRIDYLEGPLDQSELSHL